MPPGIDTKLMDELSCALLTAMTSGPDVSFHHDRQIYYLHLIFSLTRNNRWCQHLIHDGHLERCISLADEVCRRQVWYIGCHLPAIFSHIIPSGNDILFSPAQDSNGNYIDAVPALVTATRLNLPSPDNGAPREWLAGLTEEVHGALAKLQERQATFVNDGAQAAVDTAISSVQDLTPEHLAKGQTVFGVMKGLH
ncbi:hypothetical protein EDB19DRAFT_1826961 [Suillus lakei]|nr:hypothetical protein EDB19DRAFT_1826961 [Suillus lakei]